LGGASAGRRFFAGRGDNVIPANISDISGLVSSCRLPIDLVLLQVSGPDATGRYNAGLGIEHLHAAIGRARLVIAQDLRHGAARSEVYPFSVILRDRERTMGFPQRAHITRREVSRCRPVCSHGAGRPRAPRLHLGS
jgi:hypothetical protein